MILAYITSFLIGYLFILYLTREKAYPFALHAAMAAGTGLAVSASLTLLSIILCNGFERKPVIAANIITLLFLLWLNRHPLRIKYQQLKNIPRILKNAHPAETLSCLLFYISLGVAGFVILRFALIKHPYGEWDAWALWNMKLKFLLEGGHRWKEIFNLHWHTQPDYPIFLPSLNAWIYAVAGSDFYFIPLLTGVVFTILTASLLFGSLQNLTKSGFALLAFLILVTNPFYIFIGTSQYADVLLAFFILASLINCLEGIRENSLGRLLLGGILLGFTASVKNEGLLISLILLVLTSASVFKHIRKTQLLKIWGGWLFATSPGLLIKLFYAPVNRDINLESMLSLQKLFSFSRCLEILKELIIVLWHPHWRWLTLLIIIMYLLSRNRKSKEVKIVVGFFLTYLGCLFIVYLTTLNFDLAWRLNRTMPRIIFYLIPSAFFGALYAYFKEFDMYTRNKS